MHRKSSSSAGRHAINSHIAYFPEGKCYVNLAGSYDYLESPYYVSQARELNGDAIHPTCKEMLDAYIPPLFLQKARLAGLSTPEYYISNGYFEPPVIIDPINPFMIRSRVVLKSGREEAVAKSMTRNYTYGICCQELPPGSRVVRFRSVLGWCFHTHYRTMSKAIWEVFRIPLAKVRAVVKDDGSMSLSDISQLPYESLSARERNYLGERVQWEK
jgi:hypothetical protein